MMRREIICGTVLSLVLFLNAVVFGQEDVEVEGVLQRVWDEVVTQAGPSADEQHVNKMFLDALLRELGPEHPAVLRVQANMAMILDHNGDYTGARELLERILPIFVKTQGEEHLDTLTTKNNIASIMWRSGKFDEAINLNKEVLEARERVLGPDHPHTLTSKNNMALNLSELGDYKRSRKLQEEVLEARSRVLGADHESTLTAKVNLANTLKYIGNFKEAQEKYESALGPMVRTLGPENHLTLTAKANLAITLEAQGEYLAALELGEEVLEIRENVFGPKHPDTLTSMANLASTLWHRGDTNRARELIEAVIEVRHDVLGPEHPHTLMVRANLANVFKTQGDYKAAQEIDEDTLDIRRRVLGRNHPDTLTSMANLASALKLQGHFDDARNIEEEVLKIRRDVLGPKHAETLMAITALVDTLSRQGNLKVAREQCEAAIVTSKDALGAEHPSTLRAKSALANILMIQKNFAGARKIEEELLPVFERVFGANHPETMTAESNLAHTLNSLGDFDQALRRKENLLEKRIKNLGHDHPETLTVMGSLALTLKAKNEYNSAKKWEERALEIQKRTLGIDHPSTLTTMHNLATTLYYTRNYEGALVLYHEIIRIRRSSSGVDYRPDTSEEIENLAFIAYTYLRKPEPDLNAAADFFLQALGALENQVKQIGDSENLKSSFKSTYEAYYRDTIAVLIALGRRAEAYHILERFRAQGFLALLAHSDGIFPGIPPELEDRRRQLAARYDATIRQRDKLHSRWNKEAFGTLLGEQDVLRRDRERLYAQIRLHAPKGSDLKPLKAAEIRRKLEPGTLMLSYLVGPEQTHVFALTKNSVVVVHEIGVGETELWEQVGRFFDQLQKTHLDAGRSEMASWLYEKLIGPVAEYAVGSERLLITPDGPLHYLPFTALVRPDGKYLVEEIPVHHATSATVYIHLLQQRPLAESLHDGPPFQIVAFGNPSYPQGQVETNVIVGSAVQRGFFDGGLDPLPFTEHEVTGLIKSFPEAAVRTFLDSTATEENVISFGKDARILHVAAHGFTDDFTPLDSFIALTIPSIHQGQENGLLQAWEIIERARLNADLVVLSACQTSFGPEVAGDGLQSLSRAFQIAGARTVIASLWNVNDASTAELMIRFYRHLSEGKSKDEALRAAQLDFIHGPVEFEVNGEVVRKDYSSPYHWAAFQVIGDWQ